MHSVLCKHLASNGYIVFALDHNDETASYTINKEGLDVFHCNDERMSLELRAVQIKIRATELESFVDEIYEQDFLQRHLSFDQNIRLELSKLSLSGHSVGGIAAEIVA